MTPIPYMYHIMSNHLIGMTLFITRCMMGDTPIKKKTSTQPVAQISLDNMSTGLQLRNKKVTLSKERVHIAIATLPSTSKRTVKLAAEPQCYECVLSLVLHVFVRGKCRAMTSTRYMSARNPRGMERCILMGKVSW
jgi:hypothetical protein